MADLVAELIERAMDLPAEDRARLAGALLATLDSSDSAVDAAWDAEILRRIADVESGTVVLVASDAAFAQVRQSLRR